MSIYNYIYISVSVYNYNSLHIEAKQHTSSAFDSPQQLESRARAHTNVHIQAY